MKKIRQVAIIGIFFVVQLIGLNFVWAQPERSTARAGNKAYQEEAYAESEHYYRESVEQNAAFIEGNFNLGNSYFKQKDYEKALLQYQRSVDVSQDNKPVQAQAYHNIGNIYLEQKKYKEAVEAYKNALRRNPDDDQTRFNLAYAKKKLEDEQKKQNKSGGGGASPKQQDDPKSDPNKQPNQNPDKPQNNNNSDPNKPNEPSENDPKQDNNAPNSKLKKDETERLLNAIEAEEEQTQKKVNRKKVRGTPQRIEKDW